MTKAAVLGLVALLLLPAAASSPTREDGTIPLSVDVGTSSVSVTAKCSVDITNVTLQANPADETQTEWRILTACAPSAEDLSSGQFYYSLRFKGAWLQSGNVEIIKWGSHVVRQRLTLIYSDHLIGYDLAAQEVATGGFDVAIPNDVLDGPLDSPHVLVQYDSFAAGIHLPNGPQSGVGDRAPDLGEFGTYYPANGTWLSP